MLDTETIAKKGCRITILCNIQNLMGYSPGQPALVHRLQVISRDSCRPQLFCDVAVWAEAELR